jgi:hypothetical protein
MNLTVGLLVAQLFNQGGCCRRIELSTFLDYISELAVASSFEKEIQEFQKLIINWVRI